MLPIWHPWNLYKLRSATAADTPVSTVLPDFSARPSLLSRSVYGMVPKLLLPYPISNSALERKQGGQPSRCDDALSRAVEVLIIPDLAAS
jgi:hypothetical protein